MNRHAPLLVVAAAALLAACGGAEQYHYDSYDLSVRYDQPAQAQQPQYYDFDDAEIDSVMVTAESAPVSRGMLAGAGNRRERGQARSAPAPAGPTRPTAPPEPPLAISGDDTMLASNEEVPALDREAERRLPLLIYTGTLTLAAYDVDEIKTGVIELAEEMGGYAAQRTAHHVVLRVPAERFRDALDAMAELGDVLNLTWEAQDVGDEFNDLEVRLRNSRQMRARLEELLARAENVSDALAIERELERVTLEIERLEGQRRQMVDRIAFATITVSFSQIPINAVPGEEYRLPFSWLNQLGVERLLSL